MRIYCHCEVTVESCVDFCLLLKGKCGGLVVFDRAAAVCAAHYCCFSAEWLYLQAIEIAFSVWQGLEIPAAVKTHFQYLPLTLFRKPLVMQLYNVSGTSVWAQGRKVRGKKKTISTNPLLGSPPPQYLAGIQNNDHSVIVHRFPPRAPHCLSQSQKSS